MFNYFKLITMKKILFFVLLLSVCVSNSLHSQIIGVGMNILGYTNSVSLSEYQYNTANSVTLEIRVPSYANYQYMTMDIPFGDKRVNAGVLYWTITKDEFILHIKDDSGKQKKGEFPIGLVYVRTSGTGSPYPMVISTCYWQSN